MLESNHQLKRKKLLHCIRNYLEMTEQELEKAIKNAATVKNKTL